MGILSDSAMTRDSERASEGGRERVCVSYRERPRHIERERET